LLLSPDFESDFDFAFDFDFALIFLTCPLPSVLRTWLGHAAPDATRMSPCRRCARKAFLDTRIFRYGCFFEPVRWQIVTFFGVGGGVVTVVVVVGVVVVVVDVEVLVDVDVDVDVEVDVVVEPVVVVVDPVVVVVDVDCRSAAGLLPATTAAVKPPIARSAHATSADPNLRMRVNPPFPRSTNRDRRGGAAVLNGLRLANALNVGFSEETQRNTRVSPSGRSAHMAQVAKVVTIIGSSPESFAKAAEAAVQEAAKTLRGITGADVVSMSAEVDGDRITQYRTTVNIAFAIERGDP
jgi:flavin-binding protein dodecin